MCETCGCGDTEIVSVELHDEILAVNNRTARHNREHFERAGVLAVNLMGSPGAGKTALLETTAFEFTGRGRLGALAGDLATENDAVRLRDAGIVAATINTGSACHLDAQMVHCALHEFELHGLDYLFIENVGNLVCPAVYDLGQMLNVVALSVTEGEDKPLKYPFMFRKADAVVLTKIDLLPHLRVSVAGMEDALSRVLPEPLLFKVSAHTGEGLEEWAAWLGARRAAAIEAARAKRAGTLAALV
jgi:hydrogenase nickel incorporation protein HypB